MESKNKPNQSVVIEKLVEKERELRALMLETYKNEGFSKVNLLQRSLLYNVNTLYTISMHINT